MHGMQNSGKASKSRALELHSHQLLQAVMLTCTDFKLEQFLGYVRINGYN